LSRLNAVTVDISSQLVCKLHCSLMCMVLFVCITFWMFLVLNGRCVAYCYLFTLVLVFRLMFLCVALKWCFVPLKSNNLSTVRNGVSINETVIV